jgi:hypothetical protein
MKGAANLLFGPAKQPLSKNMVRANDLLVERVKLKEKSPVHPAHNLA